MKRPTEKRRVIGKTYFNRNVLYLLQVFERNCFKCWVTVANTTDKNFAERWERQS
jgi:hypothetical protein